MAKDKISKPKTYIKGRQIESWQLEPGDMKRAKFLYRKARADQKSHMLCKKNLLTCLGIILGTFIITMACTSLNYPNLGKIIFPTLVIPGIILQIFRAYQKDILRIQKTENYLDFIEKITK